MHLQRRKGQIMAWGLLALILGLISTTLIYAQPRPDAPEFAQRGPYKVGTSELSLEDETRPLDMSIWYPASAEETREEGNSYTYAIYNFSGSAISDALPNLEDGPFPLVVFSHGSGGYRYQSRYLMEHLASQGYVVIATDHPTNTVIDALSDSFTDSIASNYVYRPQDIRRVIDHAEALASSDRFGGLIDTNRVAVMGHSFGGYTALAATGQRLNFDQLAEVCAAINQQQPDLAETVCFLLDDEQQVVDAFGLESAPDGAYPPISDPRIDAVITLAPWNGPILDLQTLSGSTLPMLSIVGSSDSTTPPERDAYFIFQRMTQAPRTQVALSLADHYIFVDACTDVEIRLGFFDSCSDDVWDMARGHDLIKHYVTAFLKTTFEGDADAANVLVNGSPYRGVSVFAEGGSIQGALNTTPRLVPEVISRRPHDTGAWTQGLLLHNGLFYEGTGGNGGNDLRVVDPQTGEVLQRVPLDPAYYGEGLALVEDRLIQITWQENTAFVYDLETLEQTGTFNYEGEGWGLCYDGSALYMSNGSSVITRRDPVTFEALENIPVSAGGRLIDQLNELECVGDQIYANVWQTDYIVIIDKATGEITAHIDANSMRSEEERQGNVLNGIAYDAENEVFFITGKLWPLMYEVRFVAAP